MTEHFAAGLLLAHVLVFGAFTLVFLLPAAAMLYYFRSPTNFN